MGWLDALIKWLYKALMPSQDHITEIRLDVPMETLPEPTVEAPKLPSKREKLYNVAYACLGIDMAPTQDYVGCAEAVSFVMKKAGVPGLPKSGILSTFELDKWMAKNLTRVNTPEFGDVAMFPTGTGNGSIRGHVFIVGKHKWMSNNSNTTLWDDHWKGAEALAYYQKKGGINARYYRWV